MAVSPMQLGVPPKMIQVLEINSIAHTSLPTLVQSSFMSFWILEVLDCSCIKKQLTTQGMTILPIVATCLPRRSVLSLVFSHSCNFVSVWNVAYCAKHDGVNASDLSIIGATLFEFHQPCVSVPARVCMCACVCVCVCVRVCEPLLLFAASQTELQFLQHMLPASTVKQPVLNHNDVESFKSWMQGMSRDDRDMNKATTWALRRAMPWLFSSLINSTCLLQVEMNRPVKNLFAVSRWFIKKSFHNLILWTSDELDFWTPIKSINNFLKGCLKFSWPSWEVDT